MRKPRLADATRLSRRTLLGAASAVPSVGGQVGARFPFNDTVAQCAAWIALDLEIDRLARRWSQLEALMVRDHRWFALSHAGRRALPEAAEMYEIDDRLEALSRQLEQMLQLLSERQAGTLHGVASKLVIAARLMRHEEHPAQPFVASAVRELPQLRCPGCGAAYVPAGAAERR